MMKFFKDKKNGGKEISGFAMLFAVLASSLLISIGISIFNISLKELQIATSEQASQSAYYAADSAEECALYWDIKQGAFPVCLDAASGCDSSNPSAPGTVSTTTSPTIICNNNLMNLSYFAEDVNQNDAGLVYQGNTLSYVYSTSTFFSYGVGPLYPNAGITIAKTLIPGINPTIQTTIIAEGLSSGEIGRRVERGISETHNN